MIKAILTRGNKVAAMLTLILLAQPLVYPFGIRAEELPNTAPVFSNTTIYTSNAGDITGKFSRYYEPTLKPIVGGDVLVASTVTDNEGNLVTVRSGINPTWYQDTTDINGLANGIYGFVFDSLGFSNGIKDIRFDAIDGVLGTNEIKNTVSNNFEMIVDNTAPVVDYGVSTPVNGSAAVGTITLDANVSDDWGLHEIGFGFQGEAPICLFAPANEYVNSTPSNGYYTCDIDTTAFVDGSYTLSVYAYDKAGNGTEVATRVVEFDNNLDTTAPVFTTKDVTRDEGESVPSVSEFVLSNPENLPVTCSTVNQSDLVVAQPNNNKLIAVTCFVEDAAGNRTESTSNLIVNNVQPRVVIIANPSTVTTEGNSASLVANILAGSSSFTYNWFGSCAGNGSRSGFGLTNFVTTPSTQGSYICGVTVTDADGDTSAASVLLTVLSSTGNSSTPTQNTSDTSSNTTTTPEVLGTTVSAPVSTPTPTQQAQNVNGTTDTATATQSTSPLLIICLVAGAILIIGLLLFLFFRGEDEDEKQAATAPIKK
jgi:hypothetical protein